MIRKFSLWRATIALLLILAVALLIYDPFIILLHIYWVFLAAVIAGTVKLYRHRHRGQPEVLSLAAVVSAYCALLNPFIADFIVRLTGLPSVFGDNEIQSFFVAFSAVVAGHIALVRIRRNPHLRGRALAWIGLVFGYLITIAWVGVYVAFIWHMASWK